MRKGSEKNVALIISGNILKSPYLMYYVKLLEKNNISFDLISWNRLGLPETSSIQYNLKSSEEKAYFVRLLAYFKYIAFVKKILRNNNYKQLVIFTIPIGFFLLGLLTRNYKKNYIFDIRDRSIVGNFFKLTVSILIRNSYLTVISSDGFKSWLPKKYNYLVSHNCAFTPLYCESKHTFNKKNVLITTIGTLRDYETNSKIIMDLGNKIGYNLKFVGLGPSLSKFQKIVMDNNINNVTFTGLYNKEEELDLVLGSSFINLLINLTVNSKTCMGNRMYLAAVAGIPLIVNSKTYQAEIVLKYHLGCVLDFDNNWISQMEQYIDSFNLNDFNFGRKSFLKMVSDETEIFERKIDTYFHNK